MKILWKTLIFNKNKHVSILRLKLSKKVDTLEELSLLNNKLSHVDNKIKVIIPVSKKFLQSISKETFLKIKREFILESLPEESNRLGFIKTVFEANTHFENKANYILVNAALANYEEIIQSYAGQAEIILINVQSADQIEESKLNYFSGNFYLTPALNPDKKIESNSFSVINVLELLRTDPFIEAEAIERELKKSPDIAFNLFRHLSSASYGFKSEVTSIKQVIMLLGRRGLEEVLTNFLLTDKDNSPYSEMILDRAIIRANIMLKIIQITKNEEFYGQMYIAGVFSFLEALFEIPFDKILSHLHLDKNVEDLLLRKEGLFFKIYFIALEMEKIEFEEDKVKEVFSIFRIPIETVEEILEESILSTY